MANESIVHLGIYGDISNMILNNIRNIHRSYVNYLSNYATRRDRSRFDNLKFSRAADNEIIALVNDNMSVSDIRSWLASVVKGMAKMATYGNNASWLKNTHKAAIMKCEAWNRKNDSSVSLTNADITRMSDMYALYEVLKGRKMNWKLFSATDVKDRIVGQPFDPVRTELEISYREQVAKIEAQFKNDKDNVEKEYHEACHAIYTERNNKIHALNATRTTALEALQKEYAEFRSSAAA